MAVKVVRRVEVKCQEGQRQSREMADSSSTDDNLTIQGTAIIHSHARTIKIL